MNVISGGPKAGDHCRITWRDLQYGREQDLYGKLHPVLEDLKQQYAQFAEKSRQHEKGFLQCLSTAMRINKLDGIPKLMESIAGRLNLPVKLDMFLTQSPVANVMCQLRDLGHEAGEDDRLIVIVSQHFINELTADEQASIIGHELGHLLFGHIRIPAKAILEAEIPVNRIMDLKINVLRWMICTEISCDMIGLVSCGCKPEAFCTAMMKFSTGVSEPCLGGADKRNDLINLMLSQFEEIAASTVDSPLTTHPLMPLRIKIVNVIGSSQYLDKFGEEVDANWMRECRAEFNRMIDAEVGKIYHEIVPDAFRNEDTAEIMLFLGTAVALADGRITVDEIQALQKILDWSSTDRTREIMRNIIEQIQAASSSISISIGNILIGSARQVMTHEDIVRTVIEASVEKTKAAGLEKNEITTLIRNAVNVAAADGTVAPCELVAIYDFARYFTYSRADLEVLISQMGYHNQYQTRR